MANVKGIFLTFSGFFLVMLVVTLSILVATTLQQSNDRLMESGSLERIYALDTSLERVVADLENQIDYDLYWDDNTFAFELYLTETLNSNFNDYGSNFSSDLQSLISFVESDQQEIAFFSTAVYNSNEKLPLVVKPHGFKYTHLNQGGENVLVVYPQTYVSYIEFDLVLPEDDFGSGIQWITQNPGDGMTFVLSVEDEDGDIDIFEQNISSDSVNEFEVGGVDITVNGLCNRCVELDRNSREVVSTFHVSFPSSSELPTLNYPSGLYVLDFPELGIYLNSTSRIL
jgi:hypothetical protein